MKQLFKKIKPHIFKIYLAFIFFFFSFFTIKHNSKKILLVELIFFLICILIYKILDIKKVSKIKSFIIIYFIIGLSFLISFPIGTLPDEINHFLRAYEISNGHLVSEKVKRSNGDIYGGVKVTSELLNSFSQNYNEVKKHSKIKFDSKKDKFYYGITNISMYSFICYIPQAIGVLIGRIINVPIIYWGYLARLCNFIIFCFLSYLSLKNIPFKKLSLIFILMLPMTIQSAISISADSITIACSIFLISYVLKLRKSENKIQKKDIIILFITSLVIALSKIVYLPLVLITLLIPKEKFKTTKNKYFILFLIIGVVSILNLAWLKIASEFLSDISDRGVNSSEQLKYIFSNIFNYILIILRTYKKYFGLLIMQITGRFIGTYNIMINSFLIKISMLLLFIVLLFDNERNNKININKYTRLFILLILGLIVGLISTSLYLDWTSVKGKIIEGIQGRYFTPLLIYLAVLLSNNKLILKKNINKYIIVYMLMLDIFSFINIIRFY